MIYNNLELESRGIVLNFGSLILTIVSSLVTKANGALYGAYHNLQINEWDKKGEKWVTKTK